MVVPAPDLFTADMIRSMFQEMVRKNGLWSEPCEGIHTVSCKTPKQPGLDFELTLVWEDEIIEVTANFFRYEICGSQNEYPSYFVAIFGDIISGSIRFLCKFGKEDILPYHVMLQREHEEKWKTFAHYRRGLWRWRPRIEVVRNGFPTTPYPLASGK
jgi:hypothetical protein